MLQTTVNKSEISVLIQGLIDEKTIYCLNSVRKFFPDAEIILSTWKGQNVSDILIERYLVEQIVMLEDPGSLGYGLANTNRQIYGRAEGLNLCSRPYTLIIRSDAEIVGTNFVDVFKHKFIKRNAETTFFKERIVCCSVNRYSLFFLCDWFFYGLTDDLKNLYDIPQCNTNEIDLSKPEYNTPHEYLGVLFSRKHYNFEYGYSKMFDKTIRELWKKILVDNFITLGFYDRFGIINLKEPYYSNQKKNVKLSMSAVFHLLMNFEYEDWLLLYNKIYGEREIIKKRIEWKIAIYMLWPMFIVYKKIKNCIQKGGRESAEV